MMRMLCIIFHAGPKFTLFLNLKKLLSVLDNFLKFEFNHFNSLIIY